MISIKKLMMRRERDPSSVEHSHGQAGGPGRISDQAPFARRRAFLGKALLGFAGLALPVPALPASKRGKGDAGTPGWESLQPKEASYWDRTDRFEEKLDALQSAWDRKDYRLASAISNSLRISGIQAQSDHAGVSAPDSASTDFSEVSALPEPLRKWAKGWKYFKVISLEQVSKPKRTISPEAELLGYPVNNIPDPQFRSHEPVELSLAFKSAQVRSPSREIRLAKLEGGRLAETPSQVYDEVRRGDSWHCKLAFLAESNGAVKNVYLVFFGNPDAELPAYVSDLETEGDGYALDIQNDFFRIKLSRQTGQIESIFFKRERGLELYSGGYGHGEPPGLDWSHDYISQGYFQKLRTTLWDECPDYEIIRGPVCTIVRRWGFPYSPIHPVFSPSRINMYVEYRFYSGVPYFIKSSKFTALKELVVDNLRDDEWVFTGQAFTNKLWVSKDGKVNLGEPDAKSKNNLWGTGFYHDDNMDSIIGLFLDHRAEGLDSINHSGQPVLVNKWHGQLWSRAVLGQNTTVPAGSTLYQKNAYLVIPFTESNGPAIVEDVREELINPLRIKAGKLPVLTKNETVSGALARAGEAGDSIIPKESLWKALEMAKDGQFLSGTPVSGLLSVVELGFVYDLAVDGGTVTVIFAMPHRGRPRAEYFESGSSSHVSYKGSLNVPQALLTVPGVKKVVFQQTWYPVWTSNLITDEGRKKLQLPAI
ncbi:MAG: metal-sulfur cluster assembly factor [Daejeonella sp.]